MSDRPAYSGYSRLLNLFVPAKTKSIIEPFSLKTHGKEKNEHVNHAIGIDEFF